MQNRRKKKLTLNLFYCIVCGLPYDREFESADNICKLCEHLKWGDYERHILTLRGKNSEEGRSEKSTEDAK